MIAFLKNFFTKIGFWILISLITTSAFSGENNISSSVEIHVNVLSPPCNILPEDKSAIYVNFGGVGYQQLYNGFEPEKKFLLHLTNCNAAVAKNVKFTFIGTEELELPGMLALDPGSIASGFVIGIKSSDGEELPINKQSKNHLLQDGDNVYEFVAFLRSIPSAITDKKINSGSFSSQAILNLSYD